MKYVWIDCPRCSENNSFFLQQDVERHLRQCYGCRQWLLIHERSTADSSTVEIDRIEPLGNPPRCPLEDCDETVLGSELPQHVIREHDGSLL